MSVVRWLELIDFRCHDSIRLEPDAGVNVLVGPNGAGKTSIVEAMAYGSGLRSFRGTKDAALVRVGATRAIVRIGFQWRSGEGSIEIEIPIEGRRRVQLNGKRPPTNADLARAFPTVVFLPDDLDLVKGSPNRRRDWIDHLAAQVSPEAGAVQGEYGRALRQRNALLRREGSSADRDTLAVWDERLASAGAGVLGARRTVMREIAGSLAEGYLRVAGDGELELEYESSWAGAPDEDSASAARRLLEALVGRRDRDVELRVTSVGPHRDEPWFRLNRRPARAQASQGEQRSVALAVRIASYRLLESRTGRVPVLLLDDVFSELDESRAAGVMELVPRGQVFVTSARDDEIPLSGRRWNVSAGEIR